MRFLIDALITRDKTQRVRLTHNLLALAMLLAGVVVMLFYVWAGFVRWRHALWWTLANLSMLMLFYALIRSGWSRRLADPALTVPQMVFGISSASVAYAMGGAARGAVFPVLMVVMMFGLFALPPLSMGLLATYAVALMGAVMLLMASQLPQQYPFVVELGHFVLLATMMLALVMLSARIHRLRLRSRQQRDDLAQALLRLREDSTRDELTGLVNRRHMQTLLEQEHQRCIRSGQTLCVAMMDVDDFKRVNEAHGYDVGDAVLRAVADEALRQVRLSDRLARWGEDAFVLLMPDSRAALARGGLERLLDKVRALRILHGMQALGVTMSGGLAEHHAGESMGDTLARAEWALGEARAQGPGHVVVAA